MNQEAADLINRLVIPTKCQEKLVLINPLSTIFYF